MLLNTSRISNALRKIFNLLWTWKIIYLSLIIAAIEILIWIIQTLLFAHHSTVIFFQSAIKHTIFFYCKSESIGNFAAAACIQNSRGHQKLLQTRSRSFSETPLEKDCTRLVLLLNKQFVSHSIQIIIIMTNESYEVTVNIFKLDAKSL